MKPENFTFLAQFLKIESGLIITEEKAYLVESRLVPLARKRGLADLDDLVIAVRGKKDANLNNDVVEAMTTNESFFFRDIKPFESLKNTVLPKIVPARKAANAKKIRIWSAACSSGQEPYTIAMMLKENPAILQGLDVEIIGTDISNEILDKAREGIYTQFEAQRGLPIQLLMKYFTQVGEHWQINEDIRGMVQLHHANLLQDLSRLGKFDAVFCRNVLIYFEAPTKAQVLGRIRAMMPDDGYLFLGAAETVVGISDSFKTISGERGVYATDTATAMVAAAAAAVPKPAAPPIAKSA
ncbi:MAG: protein-glutamate O-methyltransferase CheR [Proteobacteria bacterium]|nr:protein-glutamate O-methyltransferase CheR [Pseudomonadota bacterium]MDA1327226.1 protein-glutamate O-methyltransferase CheR [Pseudomonadota bacterium]